SILEWSTKINAGLLLACANCSSVCMTIGLPLSSRNCLGRSFFIRLPLPPATIMAYLFCMLQIKSYFLFHGKKYIKKSIILQLTSFFGIIDHGYRSRNTFF